MHTVLGASRQQALSTLDEPVHKTLLRDLQRIGSKLYHVLLPRGRGIPALRDCERGEREERRGKSVTNECTLVGDLWGPLLLCLILASLLASEARDSQAPLVFATVFVIVWLGAGIVTVNALLLGGTISFFQSVCVLGYCLAPLVIVAFIKYILVQLSAMGSGTMRFLELAVVFAAYLWATTASVGFLAGKDAMRCSAVACLYAFV
jgi:protein YIPF6